MRITCVLIGLSVMAPAAPQQATIVGPKVLVVGANSAGAVRATYKCSGFGVGPVVDVHTIGRANALIQDLDLFITAPGEASFSFSLNYEGGTTNPKEVWIFVSRGTGGANDKPEKLKVNILRAR